MATGFYLLDNPPARTQGQYPRRNGGKLTGTVVLHTAENPTDFEGVDTGAEAVANYIRTRTTPGSYHRLTDKDSLIKLLPWEWEAWHETTVNNWAVGISIAVRAADWSKMTILIQDQYLMNCVAAAVDFHNYMLSEYGIKVPARLLSRAEAVARKPGFIGHGMIDTTRRSDPGRDFPWEYFLRLYAQATGQAPKPPVVKPPAPTPKPPAPTPVSEYNMDVLDLRNAHIKSVRGKHVDNLQGLLLATRLYPAKGLVGADGRPDGYAGPTTRQRLGDFQIRTNTGDGKGNPDYIVGPKCWKALIEY